jgi:hypothetical protein
MPECVNNYWMKDKNKNPKKISKKKWFDLYNTSDVEVLPPLTKEVD